MQQEPIVVTVDGPAGAGKSTVAKALAAELDFFYLDTGAMYRALTLKAMRAGVDLADEQDLVDLASTTVISLLSNRDHGTVVLMDGEDVSEEIRALDVTNNTFYIARAPQVRSIMVEWQREMGQRQNVVVEGRDVGTVVFPQARYKFYLDANFEERAQRRIKELRQKGKAVEDQALKQDLQARDQKDFSREVGPLKKADDAVVIDSTQLSIDGVVAEMLKDIKGQ